MSRSGHDGPMERVRGETSPSRRGRHGALGGKRAADARARALLPTIRKLMAAGFVSQRALANELNRRVILAAGGGRWHRTAVVRTLTRLGLITNGRIYIALAHRQAADARAKALASTIRALQAKGFVSFKASARELNEREIPTARGGKWHPTSVSRLRHRLERLELSSGHRRR
jgi:hypothetical protein